MGWELYYVSKGPHKGRITEPCVCLSNRIELTVCQQLCTCTHGGVGLRCGGGVMAARERKQTDTKCWRGWKKTCKKTEGG